MTERTETTHCPFCRYPLKSGRRRASNDHILPRVRGGTDILYGDVRNTRTTCQTCNLWLSQCGYCVGALMCVTAVAGWRRGAFARTYKQWGLGRIAGQLMRPIEYRHPGISPLTEADLAGLPPELIEQLSAPARELAKRMQRQQ